jgi:dihydroorotase
MTMRTQNVLLRGGRVLDPATGLDELADVRVAGGLVRDIDPSLSPMPGERVFQGEGCLVTPGWIDAHVHLRDPGLTHKEDLQSGADAALAGGFVRVCAMPNTNPALDSAERVADIVARGAATGARVHPIGTISLGRQGVDLAPLRAMAQAGAIGFSDDGDSTRSEDVMRAALTLSRELRRPIMVHCEDPELARGGAMHRGAVSQRLGDAGIPPEAEESYIERDIALARETGGWLHVLHVSTARGAQLVEEAKRDGVWVTAEVMPHHLLLTDEWVAGARRFAGESHALSSRPSPDPQAKVNPPLRPEADALGLRAALKRSAFDFMATDHAPHAAADKPDDLRRAASGMTGLEVAIPQMARLVEQGALDWPAVVDWFTHSPARTLHLEGGALQVGALADITVIDPARAWTIDATTLRSRSKNSPLLGLTLRGRAVLTLVEGNVRHNELS